MPHKLARDLVLFISLALTAALPVCAQTQQQTPGGRIGDARPEEASPPAVRIENLQSAPLVLRLAAVEPVPDKPKLVKLVLQVEAKDAASIKSYSIHFEDEWKDQESGGGNMVTDMNSLYKPPYDVFFIAYRGGKAIVWVSSVIFADGSEWKSTLKVSPKK